MDRSNSLEYPKEKHWTEGKHKFRADNNNGELIGQTVSRASAESADTDMTHGLTWQSNANKLTLTSCMG